MSTNLYDLPPELAVEAIGDVRVVRLNRPEQLNAVDEPLHKALADVWPRLADDPDVGAVVLTGAGKAFSGGGDLTWFGAISTDARLRERVLLEGRRIVDGMVGLKAPVVAAVNGPAVGLGCSLAVLADIVVMSTNSFFADPHVAVGLVAGDGGVATWPLMTSLLKAKEYILLGDRIPAAEAERIGLANHVVEPDELMNTAMGLAQRLAALPRQAVRETKRAFNIHLQASVSRVIDFAFQAEDATFTSDDHKAAVAAILAAKR